MIGVSSGTDAAEVVTVIHGLTYEFVTAVVTVPVATIVAFASAAETGIIAKSTKKRTAIAASPDIHILFIRDFVSP